jgi:hypothetical protein
MVCPKNLGRESMEAKMVRASLKSFLLPLRGPAHAVISVALGILAWSAPSRAQVDKVEPYFAVVTRDGVPLKSRDGSPYYAVKNLSTGQVLHVDGQNQGWVRVEYPAGLSAFVKPDEAQLENDGTAIKLTTPSQLMAANIGGGERGNWWYLLEPDAKLPAGTRLAVTQVLKNPDGKAYGYLVPAPKQARGFVRREFIRPATPAEVEAATHDSGSPTPAKPPETKAADSKPGNPAPPAAPPPAPTDPLKTEPTAPPKPADAPKPVESRPIESAPTTAAPGNTPLSVPAKPRPLAKIDTLKPLFEEAKNNPAELDAAIVEFQRTIDSLGSTPEDERARKYLTPYLEILKLRASLRDTNRKTTESSTMLKKESDQVSEEVARLEKMRQYNVVGRLVASTVYDGKRLPLMFRVLSPESTSARTLAYVAPGSGFNLTDKVGRVVGVVGEAKLDESLRVNIIVPARIDVLTSSGSVESATPGPASILAPAKPAPEPAPAAPPKKDSKEEGEPDSGL